MTDLHYWALERGYGFVRAFTDTGNDLLRRSGAAGYKRAEQTWCGPIEEWKIIEAAADGVNARVAFN